MSAVSIDIPPDKKPHVWKQRLKKIQTFVVENYLPIAFAVAVTFALAYPVPGRFLVKIVVAGNVHIIQEVNMAIVFFLSGLALNTSELKTAMKRESWPSVAFGFVMILLFTPALGFAMREIPLEPPAFAVGLTIFCLVPTTLGIGVALVRSCKGNEAIALLLTVGTNMVGVLSMPLYLRLLFLNYDTQGLKLNIDIPDLLVKLTLTILVPSVIGKALRELSKRVEAFAKKYRTPLSLLSTTNLACIVWQTLSGARDLLFEQQAGMIVSVIVLSAAIHVFYLAVNHVIVKFLFRAPIKEHVAVVIMASQKSAPVAVTVISYVTSVPAQQGLLAIPSIVGQISQIFIGSALAKYIAPKVVKATKVAMTSASSAASLGDAKDIGLPPPPPTAAGNNGDVTGPSGGSCDGAGGPEAQPRPRKEKEEEEEEGTGGEGSGGEEGAQSSSGANSNSPTHHLQQQQQQEQQQQRRQDSPPSSGRLASSGVPTPPEGAPMGVPLAARVPHLVATFSTDGDAGNGT